MKWNTAAARLPAAFSEACLDAAFHTIDRNNYEAFVTG
ncbi:hypothetical protein GGU45_001227 [Niabella hirudinis]